MPEKPKDSSKEKTEYSLSQPQVNGEWNIDAVAGTLSSFIKKRFGQGKTFKILAKGFDEEQMLTVDEILACLEDQDLPPFEIFRSQTIQRRKFEMFECNEAYTENEDTVTACFEVRKTVEKKAPKKVLAKAVTQRPAEDKPTVQAAVIVNIASEDEIYETVIVKP